MLQKINRQKYLEIFLLALIIILGLFLRVFPAFKLEIWFDEAYTVFTSNQPFWRLIWLEPVHPPLFYWLIKIWSQIRTDVFFLRIPSLIFSFFNFLLIYLIAKEIKFNKYFPTLTVLFFTLSHLNIEESFQIRMYALVLMLMLLSFWAFLKILFNSQGLKFYLFVFCLVNFLGLFTDYAFIWYYLALTLGVFIFLFLRENRLSKKQLIFLDYGFWISSALMILWLPVFVRNLSRALSYLYSPPSILREIKGLFLSSQTSLFSFDSIYFFILMICASYGGFLLLRVFLHSKRTKEFSVWLIINLFFYLTIFGAIIIFLFFNHTVISSRNMLVGTLFPIFSLSGLISFWWSQKKFFWQFLGGIILIFIILVGFLSLKNSFLYRGKTFNGAPSAKDAAEFVKNNMKFDSETLIFIPRWEYLVFNYYFLDYDQKEKKDKLTEGVYKRQVYENVLSERKKGKYLFVNFYYDEYFKEKYIEEKDDFLSECLKFNKTVHYKDAYFLRCSID